MGEGVNESSGRREFPAQSQRLLYRGPRSHGGRGKAAPALSISMNVSRMQSANALHLVHFAGLSLQ